MPAAVIASAATAPVVAVMMVMAATGAAFCMGHRTEIGSLGLRGGSKREADHASKGKGGKDDGEQFFHIGRAGCSLQIRLTSGKLYSRPSKKSEGLATRRTLTIRLREFSRSFTQPTLHTIHQHHE